MRPAASSCGQLLVSAGDTLLRVLPVGVGRPDALTPPGRFRILERRAHPGGAWGTRWLRFTEAGHAVRGTNRAGELGAALSWGCLVLHNRDVDWLDGAIRVGTPLEVVAGTPAG